VTLHRRALAFMLALTACSGDGASSTESARLTERRGGDGIAGAAREENPQRATPPPSAERCALIVAAAPAATAAATPLSLAGRVATREGPILRIAGGDGPLVMGVIADLRGGDARSLERVAAARRAFERRAVELVVSLGGLGRTEAEIGAALRAVAERASWPVLAIPGDRESVADHRAAIGATTATGVAAVVDGSEVRLALFDGVAIITLPGVDDPRRLTAGAAGCVHAAPDLDALAALARTAPGPVVLATYAPPRQRGLGASDVVQGGIHIGEPLVAELVAALSPSLVVHAGVDEAVAAGSTRGQGPAPVATGALSPLPLWLDDGRVVGGSALVLTISRTRAAWERIILPVDAS
jgi:hypothetical protein